MAEVQSTARSCAQQITIPNTPNFKDLTGCTFGKLTVVGYAGQNERQQGANWLCRCDCGQEKVIYGSHLRRGAIVSCGCYRLESARDRHVTHGGRRTPEYKVWCGIKERCLNPNSKAYINYGGRGITVCDRWVKSFAAFLSDMGKRPRSGYELDRIDVNRGYEPNNCRWVKPIVNARNKRTSHLLTFKGETLCISEWAERLGCRQQAILSRIRRGWSVEQALTTPISTLRYKRFSHSQARKD